MVGGIGLVEFEHRKLGVMPGGQALVTKVTVDFKHLFKAAHQQSFEVELRRYAQKQVHVEGIMVGLKRLGRSPSRYRLHHGGFNFHKTAVRQKFPDQADDFHPFTEGSTDFRVDDQVYIALPVAGLNIGEAVKFFRQRPQ